MQQSRNIWVISDTHFGHDNIIKYCNRPFKDSAEMDDFMLTAWNETVKDQDIVYHLGDVYFRFRNRSLLPLLKGRKRLILGNHDNGKDSSLHEAFQQIMVWRMFPEYGVLLTHVPVHADSLRAGLRKDQPYTLINVHGHIHDRVIDDKQYRNVSVEQIGYRPINIEELACTKSAKSA